MNLIVKTFDELENSELYEILKSRSLIFLKEQNIHYVDMDDIDYDAIHFFFKENNQIIGYLRRYFENNDKTTLKLGRVLTLMHNNGIGTELLSKSIEYIKNNLNINKIILDSQKQAISFYQKFGFKITSKEFLEEGIIHQKMEFEKSK